VAVAGLLDHKTGTVLRSPNITVLTGVPLLSILSERFGLPVFVENDANAAALGEKWLGAGKMFDSFILLTVGTGIGCGVVVNGNVLPVAAEAGHITIRDDGPSCGCGNTGCLEQYASASAVIGRAIREMEQGKQSLLRGAYQGNIYKITAEDIYRAALDGDSLARTVLRDAGRVLGTGIGMLINLFSPDAVIVTGGLTGAWNIYGEAAIQEASRRALPELFGRTRIVTSVHVDDAGLFGAARLVFDNLSQVNKDQ
ncbi:MAG TPA: ROK family protein, partial [Dissulfurispiraceae bacterium]|nr:ROK family protein [Dissulfurispiraceae bacterium]